MTTRRGDNVGNHKGPLGVVDAVFEMECFEELGPISRLAIIESPLKVLAAPIVLDIYKFEEEKRKTNPEFYLNLQDPRLDAAVAKGIRSDSLRVVLADRTEEEAKAGMIPLRPRRVLQGRKIYR